MTDIGLDTATLVAAWCEAVLYGVFLVLFSTSVYILGPLSLRTTRRINGPLLATSVALFLLISGHVSVCLVRLLDAFVENEPEPGAMAFLNNISQWTKPIGDLLYTLATLIGDGTLMYRCYVVWGSKWWIIALPMLLWLGTAVTALRAIAMEFQLQGGEGIFVSQINGWIEAFFSCTMATNGLTTGLIVLRIWRSSAEARQFGQSNLGPVMAILLESGALYSATVFVLLMLYVTHSNAQYIVLSMEVPIVGIVFSLITVRVGLNRALKASGGFSPQHSSSIRKSKLVRMGSRDGHEMQRITVARTVEVDDSLADEAMLDARSGKADSGRMV